MIKVTGLLAELTLPSSCLGLLPPSGTLNEREISFSLVCAWHLESPFYSSMVSSQIVRDPCPYSPKLSIFFGIKEMQEL